MKHIPLPLRYYNCLVLYKNGRRHLPFRYLLYLVLGICLTCSMSSCTFNNVDDPKVVVNIDDEFSLQLWEVLGADTRRLLLRASTFSQEDCLNYEILYQLSQNSNGIRISIDDIVAPSNCQEGTAAPTVEIDLGQVENGGYGLEINLQYSTIVNTGQLIVNDDEYRVQMTSTDGIYIAEQQLLRIPKGTIWGYIAADSSDLERVTAAFEQELEVYSRAKQFSAGSYGYFEIDEAAELRMAIESDFDATTTFIVDYTAGTSELENLVEQFRATYNTSADLRIFTWQGIAL